MFVKRSFYRSLVCVSITYIGDSVCVVNRKNGGNRKRLNPLVSHGRRILALVFAVTNIHGAYPARSTIAAIPLLIRRGALVANVRQPLSVNG